MHHAFFSRTIRCWNDATRRDASVDDAVCVGRDDVVRVGVSERRRRTSMGSTMRICAVSVSALRVFERIADERSETRG